MKEIIGKKYRKEGRQSRLYSVIQCSECGRLTYKRKDVQKALERGCIHCKDKQSLNVLNVYRRLTGLTHGLCIPCMELIK